MDNILLIALKRTKSIAKVVIFCSGFFASIVVWAQDYGYVAQTGHSDHITSMSITYDGKYVVTGSLDETIVSWRLSNQMQIGTVLGLRRGVCHHSYDEKKGYLAVSTYDNQVLIYDYKDSVPGLKHTIHFVKNVQLVHVIPDSKRVLAATGKELYLIDSTGNSKSYGFTETIEALTLNKAGTKAFIALYNGIIEAVEYLTTQNNMFKYNKIHKVLGEGNFVLTVSEGEWNGKQQVFYDLFRAENGKMVEHWDVIPEIPSKGLTHSNGMFGFKE